MKVVILTGLLVLLLTVRGAGQAKAPIEYNRIITEHGDTIYHADLKPILIMPRSNFRSGRDVRKYWKLAAKVKKVYPYAQKAAQLLQEYEVRYLTAGDEKKRKKYLKEIEDRLFKEYGPQLRKLTISEGRILIKLIDRETSHTSYELIKEFKGGVQAFFWQGVARIFGHNLKDEYDPEKEDQMIEQILFFMEIGII